MLIRVSRCAGSLAVVLATIAACGAPEQYEETRLAQHRHPHQGALRDETPAGSADRVLFDPDAVPGLLAGDWHEREAPLRTDEQNRREPLEGYALRHQVHATEEMVAHANAHPEEYMTVLGAYGDGSSEGVIKYLVHQEKKIEKGERKPLPPDAVPASSIVQDKIAADLREELARSTSSEPIAVMVTLKERLPTDLEPPPFSVLDFSSDQKRAVRARRDEVARRIALREQEAKVSQAQLVARLKTAGAEVEPEGSIWIANTVVARASPTLISELARDESVTKIQLDAVAEPTAGWNGTHLRSSSDFNADPYYDAGQDGEEPNPITGRNDLTVAVIDRDFNVFHRVFKDVAPPGATRVYQTWNCDNNPCTSGLPAPNPYHHGTTVTSVAAGDATDGQVSGTATYQEERSGVARESAIIMLHAGPGSSVIRALQRAVTSEADVATESLGGIADCNDVEDPWYTAVWQAEGAGVLVTASAGNDGESSTCNLAPMARATSALVVGDLYGDGSIPYSQVDLATGINQGSATGPMPATIDGAYYPGVLTQVGLAVMGYSQFCAHADDGFVSCAGTSHAAPKIAGAGILLRHYAIDVGWASRSMSRGWLRANLLTMADRANGVSTKLTSRFHRRWGAGRFQMRHPSLPDHPGLTWGWWVTQLTVSDGQVITVPIFGMGAEPALNQVKMIVLTPEEDPNNIGDVDIGLWTQNCAGSSLISDTSRDYKSMVRAGSSAGGHQLCVRVYGYHIPSQETRKVEVVVYYSNDTSMR